MKLEEANEVFRFLRKLNQEVALVQLAAIKRREHHAVRCMDGFVPSKNVFLTSAEVNRICLINSMMPESRMIVRAAKSRAMHFKAQALMGEAEYSPEDVRAFEQGKIEVVAQIDRVTTDASKRLGVPACIGLMNEEEVSRRHALVQRLPSQGMERKIAQSKIVHRRARRITEKANQI